MSCQGSLIQFVKADEGSNDGQGRGASIHPHRRPTIAYRRFLDELLAKTPFLNRLSELLDNGLLAGAADLQVLDRDLRHRTSLEDWLDGSGKPLFEAARNHETAVVSLP